MLSSTIAQTGGFLNIQTIIGLKKIGMAQRRMFSKEITNSSDFQMMSPSAQSLYFHIGMNADDDGFCEVFTIVRMTESKPDDLRALHERGLVFIIDSKVCIVKDWHTNNNVQADRYTPSKYLGDSKYGEIYTTIMQDKIQHLSRYKELTNRCIQDVSKMDTQVRLGKVSIGKERIEKDSIDNYGMSAIADASDSLKDSFSIFWNAYPKKELKKKTQEIWDRRKLGKNLKEILAFIEKAKQTDRWIKGYIKQPTVFLNNDAWNDDLSSYNDKGKTNSNVLQANQGKYENL